jgi:hypothetical protein
MNAANLMKKMREAIQSDDEEKLFNKFIDAKLDVASDITDFNGKMIIVDEAHNLFRRIINGSAPAIKFYDTVMKSNDVKLIFLTGTPISSSVYEVIPCFNMLNKQSKFPLFPEIFSDFEKYFIDADGKIVALHQNTEPLNTTKLYSSDKYYKYVLETNAGFAKKNNLRVNSYIDISELFNKFH